MKPLNGEKTHPLSAFALKALRELLEAPKPRQSLNPGVANRLAREQLVVTVARPSPFKTHRGRLIDHFEITEKGREVCR